MFDANEYNMLNLRNYIYNVHTMSSNQNVNSKTSESLNIFENSLNYHLKCDDGMRIYF